MKTYEYKRVTVACGLYGPHILWLNSEGAKGWRLVAQDYVPMGEWTGLFVREVTYNLGCLSEHRRGGRGDDMTEDELKAIEAILDRNEGERYPEGCMPMDDECRALIAEVRHLRSMIWPVYIAGKEQHKDENGQLIDPVAFVDAAKVTT